MSIKINKYLVFKPKMDHKKEINHKKHKKKTWITKKTHPSDTNPTVLKHGKW